MSRSVRNLRAARDEFAAAVLWYEEQRSGLGAEFFDCVTNVTSLIEVQPSRDPKSSCPGGRDRPAGSIRQQTLDASWFTRPYQVVYYQTDDEIVIVAVAHFKRRPGYWKGRM